MATASQRPKPGRAWLVVAALFMCTAALMGAAIFGFVMLADILARVHGWTELQSGSLVSAMWLVAPLALLAAPVIDRVGPWKLIIGGLLLLAAAFACLAVATAFWQVYAIRVLMGFGKVAIMTSVPVVVARWFDAKFNTAVAIVWAGGSAGGIVAAPLVEYLNRAEGFRATAFLIALGLLVITAIAFSASFVRQPGWVVTAAKSVEGGDVGRPVNEGLDDSPARLGRLLIGAIIAATVGLGGANVAFIALNPALLTALGMAPTVVALSVGATAGAAMIGSLAIGWLTDRIGIKWSTVAMSAIYLVGVLCSLALRQSTSSALALASATFVGCGAGAAEVLWIALLKRETDVQQFVKAYGIWYFALQAGYALGGVGGGWLLANAGGTGFIVAVAVAFASTPVFALWRGFGRAGRHETVEQLADAAINRSRHAQLTNGEA